MNKTYKITDPDHPHYGRMITTINSVDGNGHQTIILANATQKQEFVLNSLLDNLRDKEHTINVDLEKAHWVHPHLYKPIKLAIANILEKKAKAKPTTEYAPQPTQDIDQHQ